MAVTRVVINHSEVNRLWGHTGEVAVYMHGRADAVAHRQQSRAAVDTGRMRASVSTTGPDVDPLGMTMQVGPTATDPRSGFYYPAAVEFGTRWMAAQPFIRPSADGVAEGL